MSVFVVRAFVKIREALTTHKDLAKKLKELEQKVGNHGEAIKAIILTIQELIDGKKKLKTRKIGFEREGKK